MPANFWSVDDSLPTAPPNVATATTANSHAELWRAGRYHELSAQLTDELRQAEVRGDREALIEVANDLACTHRAAGDRETASYFQLLAATAERQSVDGQLGHISATSLGNLACDALLVGRLEVAEGLLWKSLLSELAAGNDAGIAADWANLGLLAGLLGDFDAAQERLWSALKLHRRRGDSFHVALDLWHLAYLFETEGDWQRASRLYDRAARWFGVAKNSEFHQAASHRACVNAAREAVFAFDVQLN